MKGTKKAAGEAARKNIFVQVDADYSAFAKELREAAKLAKSHLPQKS